MMCYRWVGLVGGQGTCPRYASADMARACVNAETVPAFLPENISQQETVGKERSAGLFRSIGTGAGTTGMSFMAVSWPWALHGGVGGAYVAIQSHTPHVR